MYFVLSQSTTVAEADSLSHMQRFQIQSLALQQFIHPFKFGTKVVSKVSDLAYNQRETQEKQQLGRDPDRSWCHHHTSVKLF